jgi:sortase (surface protein transpeptidase)
VGGADRTAHRAWPGLGASLLTGPLFSTIKIAAALGSASTHGTDRRPGLRQALGLSLAAVGLAAAAVGASFLTGLLQIGGGTALAAQSRARGATPRQMPNPIRISIPAIGVDARVISLGLNRDQTIQVPKNLADAGWFRPGPEPGEQGAAVIVGHLDSIHGPGVFYRLGELRVGDVITVHLQGGSTVRFVARSMLRVAKNRFPTRRVYARTPQPTLRLITCAGKLNPVTGHHTDNYIVFATLLR